MGGETKTKAKTKANTKAKTKAKANLPSAGRDEDEDLVHWFKIKRDVILKRSEKSHEFLQNLVFKSLFPNS